MLEWWVLTLSPLNIPEYIPGTSIKIDGALLILTLVAVISLLCKTLLKLDSIMSVLKLTLLGALVCFNAELVFQLIRQGTADNVSIGEKVTGFFRGLFVDVSLCITICFLTAFQIKTKKTGLLMLFIVLLLLLINLLRKHYGA